MFFRFIFLMAALLLCSCVSTHHEVNADRIHASGDKTFKIGTIKVPCKLQCLPTFSPYGATQQLATANNTNPQDVLDVVSDSYGLQVDNNIEFEEKSYPIHFTALISKDMGRCHYLENTADQENENLINITYELSAVCLPGRPISAVVGYEVVIKAEGEVLAEHQGEIETIEFGYKWIDANDINKIITTAKKIPLVLKQDIETTIKK